MIQKFILIFFLQFILYIPLGKTKNSVVSPKRDNPNFVRDRKKGLINKPQMPDTWTHRFKQPFDPAWMDYCDPYHCNDYHRMVCGLNRKIMKFKWFQSICHLILHNQCANYRGAIKYDFVANKYCRAYVMFLRGGCPTECSDEVDPICAMSSVDGDVALFKNECCLLSMNCKNNTLDEYDQVYMGICEYTLLSRAEEEEQKINNNNK